MAERRAYRGETLEDALRLVREELGPEAIVVRQREGIIGGIGGFFGRRCVELEVEAPPEPADAADLWAEETWAEPVPTTPRTLPARAVIDLYDSGDAPEHETVAPAAGPWPLQYAPPASATFTSPLDRYLAANDAVEFATDELQAVREPEQAEPAAEPESPLVRTLFEQASPFADELAHAFERVELEMLPAVELETLPAVAPEPVVVVAEPEPEPEPLPVLAPVVAPIFDPAGMTRRLVTAGLEERIARDVVAEATSELRLFDPTTPFDRQVQTVLARRIRVTRMSRRKGRRVIALVGPAGSGKTLTAARLCHAYGARRSVAALSLEPVRDAFELAQHTKGLNVEFAVADDAITLQIELDKLASSELLVIDTPAVNPQDVERLGMLGLLLELVGADETHLLVPASLGADGVHAMLETVAPALGVDRLLLTHCDGPNRMSVAVSAAILLKLPISFTATGKPWGLRPADAYELAGSVAQ